MIENTTSDNSLKRKRLNLVNFKLNALLEITQAINSNLSTEKLLEQFEKLLREDLNIGKAYVYNFNGKIWQCILISDSNKKSHIDINIANSLLQYTEITILTSIQKNKTLGAFDVIIPVYHKNDPLAYVLIGDIDEERSGISPTIKHLHFIQTLANIITVAIENKRLYRESLHQESIKKELELASKMQSMLIPDPFSFPKNEKINITAYYQPYSEVGGDYYDFIKLNEYEYGFCIADVSGKGISAAMLMSNFQASLRALFTAEIDLSILIQKLNHSIVINANNEKFITVFVGKYNTLRRELTYINAGHNPPVLLFVKENKFEYLNKGCIGLGMFDEIPGIKEGQIKINTQSELLCYTDGLVEMENEENEEFGTDRIEKCMLKAKSLDELNGIIMSEVIKYKGSNSFFDDITILALDFL